jgi:hypothetical protein
MPPRDNQFTPAEKLIESQSCSGRGACGFVLTAKPDNGRKTGYLSRGNQPTGVRNGVGIQEVSVAGPYSMRVLFAYNARNTRHATTDGNARSRAVQRNLWLKITAKASMAPEKIASDKNNLLLRI